VASAVARALLSLNKKEVSDRELFFAVQASESVFHGNPSGIDATLSLGGGVIVFSMDCGVTPLSVSLPRLMVVHSGAPGDTRHTVARFAGKMESARKEAMRRVEEIDALVERGMAALNARAEAALGEIMLRNHEALTWFDVSSEALDRIVAAAVDAGALGAKMTGGGGGGCALVLPGRAEAAVARRMESEGFQTMAI
jgi:mevalonate kinase